MTEGIETSCFKMKAGNSSNVLKRPCSSLGGEVFVDHLGLVSELQASLMELLSMVQNIFCGHLSIREESMEEILPECVI